MQYAADEVRRDLKYLTLLAREFPNIASASSEIINLQAILKPVSYTHLTLPTT